MNLKSSIFILMLLCLFFSCSKDKDDTKPVINIISPVHLQQINGIDTILILATIIDDQNIESVRVSLRNANDIPVLSTITKTPNSNSYNLNVAYYFDDLHLPSEQYDFAISAYDGENTTTKYVAIDYNESARTREGIFVIGNSGSSSVISTLDNTYVGTPYSSISGDFIGAAVNSYDQQFIHSSGTMGSLSAIDLISGTGLWNIPILAFPYTGLLYENQTVYVGDRSGGIQGYDKYGAGNFSVPANSGFYMESAIVHDNTYFVTEQQELSGGDVSLVLHWMTGFNTPVQQAIIDEDIVSIFSLTPNIIVLFTNDIASLGKLIFYDIPNGLTYSPYNINVAEIDDCLEISPGIYLVAEGGNIMTIDANNFTTTPYLTGINASKIWYDEVANELFAANGNNVDIYDYTSKTLKGSYSHSNIIEEIVFWYNK